MLEQQICPVPARRAWLALEGGMCHCWGVLLDPEQHLTFMLTESEHFLLCLVLE